MIHCSKELTARREQLIASCAQQRAALSVQGHAVMEKLTAFDMGLTLLGRLKKNPAWITVVVLGLVAIKPRRLLTALQTGLLALQTFSTVAPLLQKFIKRRPDQ